MRVLVTSPATLGHLQPLVPLARALVASGAEVLWATPEDGVAEVERRGIPAVSTAPALPIGPALAMERYPELRAMPPEQVPTVMFGKLFGAIAAPAMVDGVRSVVRDWRPDVVVCDAAEFAGHIAAVEAGLPSVTKGFGPLLPEPRVAAAAEEVAPLWESCGLEPRPYGGSYDTLYLDPYPPSLQLGPADHVPRRSMIRPEGDYDAAASTGEVPLPPGDDPLVYVTLGTMFSDPEPLATIVEALADLGVRGLVTVGPKGDPELLGTTPPGVRVERYVPQHAVFPHCTAVVSHGGSGTALGALAAGLPQLCLPQGADQFLNAAAIDRAGAGLSLAPAAFSAAAVAERLAALLGDDTFAAASDRVASEIEAMPSAGDAARVVMTL